MRELASMRPRLAEPRSRLLIPATFAVALLLTIVPVPQWMQFARPDWVTLALFYWCMTAPRRVGIGYGWVMGLLIDVMHYTLFGQHALGKAAIAFIVVSAYPRLRLHTLRQQCAMVLILAAIDVTIVVWIHYLTSGVEVRLAYWQAAVTTALLWPAAQVLLRKVGP